MTDNTRAWQILHFCELFSNSEANTVVLYIKRKVILCPTLAYITHSKKVKSEEKVKKKVNIFCGNTVQLTLH